MRHTASLLPRAWAALNKASATIGAARGLSAGLQGRGRARQQQLQQGARRQGAGEREGGAAQEVVAAAARQLALLRLWHREALHFVGGVQQHVQAALLGQVWAGLEGALAGSGPLDVEQMARAHARWVAGGRDPPGRDAGKVPPGDLDGSRS